MNDRRITTDHSKKSDRLNHIAGLIEKLTYSEMKTLADHIGQTLDVNREGLEDDLIQLSKRILAQ